MSDRPVRVRFAPSPTGPLHIGGVRTALYNYLFAKKHGGTFIIRIEDTDQTRFVPQAQEYIMNALSWCGIMPTEGPGIGGEHGPYIQSERKSMYQPYAEQLVKENNAYYAFDSGDELDKMREHAKQMGMPNWQYNSVTRASMKNSLTLPADEVQRLLDAGEPYTIRFKMPRNEDIRFEDEIRGWVVVNTNNLDDKILFKSDGMPTYHLANIVDDHSMDISHVIRGEEWLPSTPLHIMLYRAFGWDSPKFAHLPLILKPNGNGKLSKRDGEKGGFPVFPTDWITSTGETFPGYREQGYFPSSFVNMLAFLGWNPGTTQEIFSHDELVDSFSLPRVSKAGAKFDPDKTKWFQQQYLRSTPNEELALQLSQLLTDNHDIESLTTICGLMKERATFTKDILTEGAFLLSPPTEYDAKTVRKKWKGHAAELMTEWSGILSSLSSFDALTIESEFKSFILSKELGIGAVLPLFRLLVTGKGMGPSMFEIAAFLGKQECIERIGNGLDAMNNLVASN